MLNYKFYNLLFAVIFVACLLSIALFNIIIDPLGLLGTPAMRGINLNKIALSSHERLHKAAELVRKKPENIFIGSSRTQVGLDPEHYLQITGKPAYNTAFVGANMYEIQRYFQHALHNQPNLKQVIVGIDFFSFNEFKKNTPDFDDSRLEKSSITLKDFIGTALTVDGIKLSVRTLKSNFKDPNEQKEYEPNGMRWNGNQETLENAKDIFIGTVQDYLTSDELYRSYSLSVAQLDRLKKLKAVCDERNIKLIIFISPSHALQWESIYAAGLWPTFEQWKRDVCQIHPVWDFSGYNSITAETVADTMKLYWDPSHYRKEVGNLVLNRLLHYKEDQVPWDFGVLITPNTVESRLETIRQERYIWTLQNPDDRNLVQQVKDEIDNDRSHKK